MIRPWKLRVELYDIVHQYDDPDDDDGEFTAAEVGNIAHECRDRLRDSGWLELVAEDEYHREELEQLFGELDVCTTVDEFNSVLNDIYDDADEDRVIVNTVFKPQEVET